MNLKSSTHCFSLSIKMDRWRQCARNHIINRRYFRFLHRLAGPFFIKSSWSLLSILTLILGYDNLIYYIDNYFKLRRYKFKIYDVEDTREHVLPWYLSLFYRIFAVQFLFLLTCLLAECLSSRCNLLPPT